MKKENKKSQQRIYNNKGVNTLSWVLYHLLPYCIYTKLLPLSLKKYRAKDGDVHHYVKNKQIDLKYFIDKYPDESERSNEICDYLHYQVDGDIPQDSKNFPILLEYHCDYMRKKHGFDPVSRELARPLIKPNPHENKYKLN